MFSKRISQPTEKAQALQEECQHKCKTHDTDNMINQHKRCRTEASTTTNQLSPQSSFNDPGMETDSTPWPTDHESTVDLISNTDRMDDTDNVDESDKEKGETSEAELGRHSHAGQKD